MDAAGTGIKRNVCSKHKRRLAGVHRMVCIEELKVFTLDSKQALGEIETCVMRNGFSHRVGNQVDLIPHLKKRIVVIGVERYSTAGRKRPGCRRPDHDIDVASLQDRELLHHFIIHLIRNKHRRRSDVGIFDLCGGLSSLAVDAPVNRLRAAIDESLFNDRS